MFELQVLITRSQNLKQSSEIVQHKGNIKHISRLEIFQGLINNIFAAWIPYVWANKADT